MMLQIPFTVAVHSYLWGHASSCQLRGRFLSVFVCSWGSSFVTVLFLFSASLSLTHCFFYLSERCTFSCMVCSRGKLHRILPENFDPSQKFLKTRSFGSGPFQRIHNKTVISALAPIHLSCTVSPEVFLIGIPLIVASSTMLCICRSNSKTKECQKVWWNHVLQGYLQKEDISVYSSKSVTSLDL